MKLQPRGRVTQQRRPDHRSVKQCPVGPHGLAPQATRDSGALVPGTAKGREGAKVLTSGHSAGPRGGSDFCSPCFHQVASGGGTILATSAVRGVSVFFKEKEREERRNGGEADKTGSQTSRCVFQVLANE